MSDTTANSSKPEIPAGSSAADPSDFSGTKAPKADNSQFSGMSGRGMVLYVMLVFIWGTSWIAMSLQVDVVSPVVTGIYRFVIASLAMFAWAIWAKQPLRFPLHVHARLALLGVFIFSSNFVLFYYAASYMASGLMAVIFSLASLINIILAAAFLEQKPSMQAVLGAILGFGGIGLIFWPEIAANSGKDGILIGLGFGLAGTMSFCTGNMIATANKKLDLPLISSNAWGMFYGTLWLIIVALVLGKPFAIEWTWTYWGAMVWLAIIASVVAFWGYMTLLNDIGPGRAGYITVLFPIVALAISTIFEGYQWTILGLIGLAAIIIGNILVMQQGKK